jgi:WD40 repeat protein
MVRKLRRLSGVAALIGLAVFGSDRAQAGLTLTAAGVADGFTLSTYASGGSSVNYAFLAAAPLSNGNLAVIDFQDGLLKTYADVNGQTYGSALSSISLPSAVNIANAGGQTYATQRGVANGLYSVSNSLGLTPVSVTGGFTPVNGLAGNPVSGHLLAEGNGSAGTGVYDINPHTGANTLIVLGSDFDGVSVSPDGKTVFIESNSNSILGYDIATHALVFIASSSHLPDGTGAIAGGLFNGDVIANNNDGTVSLIDPTTNIQTIIASGGSRGDFTSPDTHDGSLLLSEYGFMYRLNAPGGAFGGVPEPTSLTMFGIGIAGMVGYCWRRRKLAAN